MEKISAYVAQLTRPHVSVVVVFVIDSIVVSGVYGVSQDLSGNILKFGGSYSSHLEISRKSIEISEELRRIDLGSIIAVDPPSTCFYFTHLVIRLSWSVEFLNSGATVVVLGLDTCLPNNSFRKSLVSVLSTNA